MPPSLTAQSAFLSTRRTSGILFISPIRQIARLEEERQAYLDQFQDPSEIERRKALHRQRWLAQRGLAETPD
jgi:hypothetical protein